MNSKNFEDFKKNLINENENQHGIELREKYGHDIVDVSNSHLKGLTQAQFNESEKLRLELETTLASAVKIDDPYGDMARHAFELHRAWLKVFYPNYSKEYHMGLADMYLADPRFKMYYDKIAPNAAKFLHDVIDGFLRNE